MEMKPGIKGMAETAVTPDNTADKVGSGAMPVFATPSMIGLMEKAALTSVQPWLEKGQATVGIKIDVAHLAATPIGMTVRAESELTAINKRVLTFKVCAYAGDELVGEGIHIRSIIDEQRFMEKAQAKLK